VKVMKIRLKINYNSINESNKIIHKNKLLAKKRGR